VAKHWYNKDSEPVCEDCAAKHDLGEPDLDSNETDTPQNCTYCGRRCEYTLTDAGIAYVMEYVEQALAEAAEARNTLIADPESYYNGSRHVEIVRDWAKDLKWYGLDKDVETRLDEFLRITA
jgi:hypothetical protein